jgi:murein DD-endopeptidase MepM/ murein hydrolase activator NlpD
MKNILYVAVLSVFSGVSCSSGIQQVFGNKKTPHEKYEKSLRQSGLDDTVAGRHWFAAAESALQNPQSIDLPFKLHGYFPPDKPRALGLEFDAKQGQQISFEIDRDKNPGFIIYADVYKKDDGDHEHMLSVELDSISFTFEVEESGIYIVRLQPQLNATGTYSLAAHAGPSLGFPVSGNKARTGSFWGDSRDNGARKHEGIDIFAPKLTPAIAAADGYVHSVREGGLGGKTVWMKPEGRNYSLYYAHLDKQLVKEGQYVKKGDVLGLVGNTGNAKHTPSHLHFGIYTYKGAVDPFPFVNNPKKSVPALPQKELTGFIKLIKSQKWGTVSAPANTIMTPLAVTNKGYIAELPGGELVQTLFSAVKPYKTETQPKLANKVPLHPTSLPSGM